MSCILHTVKINRCKQNLWLILLLSTEFSNNLTPRINDSAVTVTYAVLVMCTHLRRSYDLEHRQSHLNESLILVNERT